MKGDLINRLENHKDTIIKRYLDGESCGNIQKDYSYAYRSSIRNLLIRNAIKTRSPKDLKKHNFKENYFDKIDSEKKAYWLGFIFADGNVYNTTVSIMLEGKDKKHLEKFAKDIEYKYFDDYRPSKNAYRIRLNSKHMVDSLRKLNVTPKKARIISMPNLEDKFKIPFMRGFFDGDGSIYFTKIERRKQWACKVTSFSLGFLKSYKKEMDYLLKEQRGNIDNFSLSWTGNWNALKVMNIIYDGAHIFLKRKHKKYLDF